jgi:hypothetical protein
MFSYSTGYYVSPPDDQYLKFKNRCSLLATQVHVISGLRSYNRARLDIAAANTALNRVDQILPL